jgi:polysaccharide biosynthesis transport protein
MDAIQTYRGDATVPSPHRPAPAPVALNPAVVKSTSDYLKALRRRTWMVLAVAVPIAAMGTIVALRLPPVYIVKAEIQIEASDFDPVLSTLVSHEITRRDAASQERSIPNRAGLLKSQRLLENVVRRNDIKADVSQFEDPVAELFRSLTFLPIQRNSNTYLVTLEGRDPFRTKRLVEVLLDEFAREAKEEIRTKMYDSEERADTNIKTLEEELVKLDDHIKSKLETNTTLGAGGKSIIEERVVNLATMMSQKQMKLGELSQQMVLFQQMPRLDMSPEAARRAAMIESLDMERRRYTEMLRITKLRARNWTQDPAALAASRKLETILDEIDSLKNVRTEVSMTPTEMILEQYQKEIDADKQEHARLLREMRASLPMHQEVLNLMRDREEKRKRIAEMKVKIEDFRTLSNTPSVTEVVKVPSVIAEPSVPIKPNRPLLIVGSLILSLAAGIGLVCLLEHIDHSVKVPEHASHGLMLPLLGVVPRIRRTALTQRGGHLWTAGDSDALAADAYRNVRAGLLGIGDRLGQIVTLLITSAKAGEGKSTTALNLAATCALAGERTLLLDADLRRPSLTDVFIEDEEPGPILGLADVLKGEVPWQRTLRHTRIPNLDFMPTGDTRDTPIEVLGSLELRQLLKSLSRHYDRVIIDGPAVLGLADCRFLGRIVDSSLLVVRSGSHHLMTLHRAKAMLEQSHVAIAGVVFNGLAEEMENWSSCPGYYGALPAVATTRDEASLALAGS